VLRLPARMEDLPTGKVTLTVDEAKFYPPANEPLEPIGDLPSSYGKNRLVLLPVDPFLVYAYWDLTADPPPTAGARAILRFHESTVAAKGSRTFDVDLDLAAGHWYVHLWSPDKVYEADLGLRTEDGAFFELAHSNTVRTPPSAPVPRAVDDVVEPAIAPPPPVPAPRFERRLAEIFAVREELPSLVEHEALPVEPDDADEVIAEVIAELIAPPFHLADLASIDLTEYSEERFTPGISSEQNG
jgi:hypothetical protein